MKMKMSSSKVMKGSSMITNPLMIIIGLVIALIVVLAIFRPASPFLNLGFGVNAHIGDLKGSINFEAFDNKSQPVFAMYFAEWCGHCKKTKPEFKKLMESYKGPIKIEMIDCENPEYADEVKKQGIKGFPTIRYFPKGKDSSDFKEYEGGRTFMDFSNYLNQVTGTLDQSPDNAAPIGGN